MDDPIKQAVMAKATQGVEEVTSRLREVEEHLKAGDDLAAFGALVGLDERVRYVATLLTILRDLRAKQPTVQQ